MTAKTERTVRPRVVVLGGGFAGLETAFTLRQTVGERAEITVVSDRDHFLFKPNSIYVPFGLDPAKLRVPLARPLARRSIEFVRDRARAIDPDARRVELNGGGLDYDFLVVATGSGMRADEIPGLAEHAHAVWSPEDMLRLRGAFADLAEAGRRAEPRRVLFLVPPQNKCSGPLYEIVLMLETWLRRQRARGSIDIAWSTYESGYIQAFGPRLHDVVAGEFERRAIHGETSRVIERVEPGEAHFAGGEKEPYDLLVAFPPYVAGTAFPGLPADERGFLLTDPDSRRVVERVFAPGDAGDFPVKQAFLAFVQGDVVASRIAFEGSGIGSGENFDPVSMCVMEQFDKATFAQVPLRLTGDPAHPVEVRPEANGDYRVGSSVAWRGGKKMLGFSVPWRFSRGLPFHSGAFWSGMDVGLRGMSRVLASGSD